MYYEAHSRFAFLELMNLSNLMTYPESEDSLESVAVSASVYIYNAQINGTQYRTESLHLLVNS